MSEFCGRAAAEQPTLDDVLSRLECIRRKTLIDGEPGKPPIIKSVTTPDLENFLTEAQTILKILAESRPSTTGEGQHWQRIWTSHHMLALHIIEETKLELQERHSASKALTHAAMRTLVL